MMMATTCSLFSSKLSIARKPVAFRRASVTPRTVSASRLIVTAADSDAKETTPAKKAKTADLRSEFTSNEAIDAEVQRLKTEMFTMRIKFAKREAYQPAQYKALRKRIAQLLTVRRERQIEQGIDRRTSRALEKRRMVEAGLGQF